MQAYKLRKQKGNWNATQKASPRPFPCGQSLVFSTESINQLTVEKVDTISLEHCHKLLTRTQSFENAHTPAKKTELQS